MNKKAQGGLAAIIIILLIVATIGSVAIGYLVKAGMINLGVKQKMAEIDSADKIIDKTYDADNAIYNYEWFKTQHEKIIAAEKQIENTKFEMDSMKEMYGEPKDWDFQTKQSYQILQAQFLGQKNQYENLVADYNARSKMANRNIFQDKDNSIKV